jgi:hypothetical protein
VPEEEEEAQEEEDPSTAKRDKGKGEKWAKLRAAGRIPAHIINMFDNVPEGEQPRQFRTQIINRLFRKTANGGFELNANDAMFQQAKSLYDRKFMRDEEVGLVKSVFAGKYFGNNYKALEDAVACGDVSVSKAADGKEYYTTKRLTIGSEKVAETSQSLRMQKKVSASDADELGELMGKLTWKFQPSNKDLKMLDGGQTLPESARKLLGQAVSAQDKLSKDTMKLLAGTNVQLPADKQKELRQAHVRAQQHHLALQHLLSFHELPSGDPINKSSLDAFLCNVAKDTDDFNIKLEMSRGYLKARRK